MKPFAFLFLTFVMWSLSEPSFAAAQKIKSTWKNSLFIEVKKIDSSFDGRLGLYVKRLGDQTEMKYNAERKWYLASTVKVPIAIALLKEVEKGRISLKKELILEKADFVDGSGDVNWKEPGEKLTVEYLLEKMLTQSDSTATDMIVDLVGAKKINSYIRQWAPGFGPVTSLLNVRYQAYSEVHPQTRKLSNMDFFDLKKVPVSERLQVLSEKLNLNPTNFKVRNVEDAFERYYAKGSNSAPLSSFARILEKLVRNQLLSKKNTDLILGHMENMTTGEKRIKAGLPDHIRFAQKTGTQIRRLCNVGILRSTQKKNSSVLVAACAEKFQDEKQAEAALEQVGRAISENKVI